MQARDMQRPLGSGAVRGEEATGRALDRRQPDASRAVTLYGGSPDDLLHRRREADGSRLIVTPNLDHWRLLARSRAFRRAYLSATIVLNDSRFLMRTFFGQGTMTLPGSELVQMMLSAAPTGCRVMVIGCSDEVRAYLLGFRTDLVIQAVEPSMGFIFKRAERRALAQSVGEFAPDRVFICIGAPQSEIFAQQLMRKLAGKCDILCCGAGLQFASGQKHRAPRWMQILGLEWSWRFMLERHTRLRYVLDALYLFKERSALTALARHRRTHLGDLRLIAPAPATEARLRAGAAHAH